MYPKQLVPNGEMEFPIKEGVIKIPTCALSFEKWPEQPIEKKKTIGGKPIVCLNNKPMFAEDAIRSLFLLDGWDARWISTYGKSRLFPIFLDGWKDLDKWEDDSYKNQRHCDIANEEIKEILSDIAKYNPKSYAGCWDVFGWKDGRVLFAESKRRKKDKIRDTQLNWLDTAIKCGLKPDNFLMVEWDFVREKAND
jgi:hypothetical protein